jgi:hypothetical protein
MPTKILDSKSAGALGTHPTDFHDVLFQFRKSNMLTVAHRLLGLIFF